ncbi:MAG: chemotaxis protein CheD [Methanococcaceae archaeon]
MRAREKRYIIIGETYASKKPITISTTLGSCVAVCLFDTKNRIGGMNHILLPGDADLNIFNDNARYGINAMEILINKILSLGGKKKNLIAKVFGGAHMLPGFSINNSTGMKNVRFVKEFLAKERIKIISQHTGGTITRVIYFHTDTAEVFLREIKSYYLRTAEQERLIMENYQTEIFKSDITFF